MPELLRFWAINHQPGLSVSWDPSVWPRLVFASKGGGVVCSQDTRWFLPQGLGFWAPAGSTFELVIKSELHLRIACFAPSDSEDLPPGLRTIRPFHRALLLEASDKAPLISGRRDHEALANLLWLEAKGAPTPSFSIPIPTSGLARSAAEMLLADHKLGIEQAAASLNLSRRHLERLFAEEMGTPLGAWAARARLAESVTLLAKGETVWSAALSCGYSTASSYIGAFRRAFGVTPGRALDSD